MSDPTRDHRRDSGRVALIRPIPLIGGTFAGEQPHHVLQGAQIPVRPITALQAVLIEVLLFGEAMQGSMLNPLSKFAATAFDFTKL